MIVGSPMLTDCVIQPNQQQEHGVENQQVQGSICPLMGLRLPRNQRCTGENPTACVQPPLRVRHDGISR